MLRIFGRSLSSQGLVTELTIHFLVLKVKLRQLVLQDANISIEHDLSWVHRVDLVRLLERSVAARDFPARASLEKRLRHLLHLRSGLSGDIIRI